MRAASAETVHIPRPATAAGRSHHGIQQYQHAQQAWSASQAHYGSSQHAHHQRSEQQYHQASSTPSSSSNAWSDVYGTEEYPTGSLISGGVSNGNHCGISRDDSAGGTSDDGSEEGLSDADIEEACKVLLDPAAMGDGLVW